MMSDGYCFDEIYLMNESYAFYISTNTYRNPIFDSCSVRESPSSSNHLEHRHDNVSSSKAKALDKRKNKINDDNNNDNNNNEDGLRRSKSSSSCKLLFISQTKEKCADFCDNFAFSLRDRLFIMETNFKLHLRAFRRFLDKKLPPWFLAPTAARQNKSQQAPEANWYINQCERGASRDYTGRNLGELLREEQLTRQQANNMTSRRQERLLNLSEPISAKALGAQQERILSRLERIKRDNQKLSSSGVLQLRPSQASEHYADEETEDDEDGGCQTTEAPYDWHDEFKQRRRGSPMPKSASSSGQMTVPCWLRSASSESAGSDTDGSRAENSAGASSTPCPLIRSHGSNLAAAAKATGPKTAPEAATTTRRSSSFIKCAKATNTNTTTGYPWRAISGKQRQTKRRADASQTNSAEQKKTCIVCYERSPNIVTLPCEHSDVCSDCFTEIIYMAVKNSQYPLRCVLCRQKVERIRCSRRLMLSVIRRNRASKSAKCALLSF